MGVRPAAGEVARSRTQARASAGDLPNPRAADSRRGDGIVGSTNHASARTSAYGPTRTQQQVIALHDDRPAP